MKRSNTLRKKYAQKFARLDDRIRRAQLGVQEYESQARDQKYQTAISLGTTLLGGFLGRKASSDATKTARDMSRSTKKKRKKEDAMENLQSLQQEKQRLESEFQTEVNMLRIPKLNPITENLESIIITPSKTNIVSSFCCTRLDANLVIDDTFYLYSYISP